MPRTRPHGMLSHRSILIAVIISFSVFFGCIASNHHKPEVSTFLGGGASPRYEGLPKDKIYPQGRLFPFSLYSVGALRPTPTTGASEVAEGVDEKRIHSEIHRVKSAGFTMIGPQGELISRAPLDAQRAGLHLIYDIGVDERGRYWYDLKSTPPAKFDPVELTARVKREVEGVAHHQSIAWWYIEPEEMRYWVADEMRYLETVARAIRESDPLGRPIVHYEQTHHNAAALAEVMKHLDVCAKGSYVNYIGQRESRVWLRWSIEQEVEAIQRSGRTHAFPILVPELFAQPPPGTEHLIPAWVRHDVYLGLICGAKGVVIYSMRERDGFPAREAYLNAYSSVASELGGPLNLGEVFLFGERRNDLKLRVIDGPADLMLRDDFAGEMGGDRRYPSVAFLDVLHAGARYLFAVNSATVSVTIKIEGLPHASLHVTELFESTRQSTVTSGGWSVRLAPLEVKAWRITR